MLNEQQINNLMSLKFINIIDNDIRVLTEFDIKYLPAKPSVVGRIIFILNIFFKGDKLSQLSFDLQNYDYEELIEIAKNIKSNDFIMYELDTYLAGDIE